MPDRMPEIMSEYIYIYANDRFSAAALLQTTRSIEVEKRAADVIAIVALYSSCCVVALGIRSIV